MSLKAYVIELNPWDKCQAIFVNKTFWDFACANKQICGTITQNI